MSQEENTVNCDLKCKYKNKIKWKFESGALWDME